MKKINRLLIKDLHVSVNDKPILRGLSMEVNGGELHVVMGPNGSGKSTLVNALMANGNYKISDSKIQIADKSIIKLKTDERVKSGLMMSWQNPVTINGVSLFNLLKTAYKEVYKQENISVLKLHEMIKLKAIQIGLNEEYLKRSLNEGFSGGEKKKAEMLQLLIMKPKFAFIDEIDTGLDVDALKVIARCITELLKNNCGVVLITHNPRLLKYLSPDQVYVMMDGLIVKQGSINLIKQIEERGYGQFRQKRKLSV